MVLPQRYKLCWLLTNSSGRGASSDAGTGDSNNDGSKACANNADDANNVDGANTDANNAAYNNAMADGASNKAIARRLGISFHTAKFHVAAILAKLNADSRTEAVVIRLFDSGIRCRSPSS